jgi:hypothetical protein
MPSFFKALIKFSRMNLVYQKQLQGQALTILANGALRYPGQENGIGFKNIERYYGFGLNIMAELICILKKEKISQKEREIFAHAGFMAAYADALMDSKEVQGQRLLELYENQKSVKPESILEYLYLSHSSEFSDKGPNPYFEECLHNCFVAQKNSKRQAEANLEFQKVKEISFVKGGNALELFASALPFSFSPSEKAFINNLGILAQYGDDLFDVYEDLKVGQKTLLTAAPSVAEAKKDFLLQLKTFHQSLECCPYGKKEINEFKNLLAIALGAYLLAFEKLQKSEIEVGGTLLSRLHKKALYLVDMEKTVNRLKMFWYFQKARKLLNGKDKFSVLF